MNQLTNQNLWCGMKHYKVVLSLPLERKSDDHNCSKPEWNINKTLEQWDDDMMVVCDEREGAVWSTHRGTLPHQIERELLTVVKRRVICRKQRIFKQHLLAHVFVPELQEVFQSQSIFHSFVAAQNGGVKIPRRLKCSPRSPRSRFCSRSSGFWHSLLSFIFLLFTGFATQALLHDWCWWSRD